jgi:cobalamin biosynthesis protein CbiD
MALSWVVDGLLLALGALVLIVGLRYLLALARGEGLREAAMMTGRWTWALIGGIFAVGAMGLVQFGDLVGMAVEFIATSPFGVSNALLTGLGAFVAGGWLELSASQFVGVAIALVGLVMLAYEVSD